MPRSAASRPPERGHGADDPRHWPVRREISAGGVVVRAGPHGHEVALVRPRTDDGREIWALPKGLVERGEGIPEAALREVLEESGIEGEIVEPLEELSYWYTWAPDRVRVRKTVHLFLMRMVGGDVSRHDHEIAEARFVPIGEAPGAASYRSEAQALRRAVELVREWWGP